MSYCLKCKKTNTKKSHILKVKITGLYEKVYVRCVVQKKINLSPNTNYNIQKEIYKSFYQEVNLQLLEYQGNYIYQGILSVVQAQTWIKD